MDKRREQIRAFIKLNQLGGGQAPSQNAFLPTAVLWFTDSWMAGAGTKKTIQPEMDHFMGERATGRS